MGESIFVGEPGGPNIYPTAIGLGFVSALVIFLDLPPLVWHSQNRNIAAACLISWIIINNFFTFLNAVIWPNDHFEDWFSGTGLCDIEVKIIVAKSTALPACIYCIMKSLADVMATRRINLAPTNAQRKRAMAVTLAFALGIPLVTMFLHYVIQPNRYVLVGISGCQPTYFQSPLTVLLLDVPALILTLVDAYLACLIIFRLKNYRSKFTSMLNAANTTKTRFLRLLILALIYIFVMFPLQLYILCLNWPRNPAPYSWSRVHDKEAWSHFIYAPSEGTILPDRWIHIAGGFLIFALFGMGQDAKTTYKSWLLAIGMGKIFPQLDRTRTRNATGQGSGSSGSRVGLTASSKARSKQKTSSTVESLTSVSSHDPITPKTSSFSALHNPDLAPPVKEPQPAITHTKNVVPTQQHSLLARFGHALHSPILPVRIMNIRLPMKPSRHEEVLPLGNMARRGP